MRKNVVDIKEEIQIGDVILEKGDKIKVLKEGFQYGEFVEEYNKCMRAITNMDFSTDDPNISRLLQVVDHAFRDIEKYMDKNSLWNK